MLSCYHRTGLTEDGRGRVLEVLNVLGVLGEELLVGEGVGDESRKSWRLLTADRTLFNIYILF